MHGRMLDFGAPFDFGLERAGLRYYEDRDDLTPDEIKYRNARRITANLMRANKMPGIEGEYWHFNPEESQMGAQVMGLPHATFLGFELSRKQWAEEVFRREHDRGVEAMLRGEKWDVPEDLQQHFDLVLECSRFINAVEIYPEEIGI